MLRELRKVREKRIDSNVREEEKKEKGSGILR